MRLVGWGEPGPLSAKVTQPPSSTPGTKRRGMPQLSNTDRAMG